MSIFYLLLRTRLYAIGSTSSELYMCAYQKNHEQYVKNGIEVEDTEIKNRFEIRMKNERAYYAV